MAVATGYYAVFGSMIGISINWNAVRIHISRLHFVGGALLVVGMLIALITRQPLQIRDAVVTTIGFVMLMTAIWEWLTVRGYRLTT
jgi:hypothetical protein